MQMKIHPLQIEGVLKKACLIRVQITNTINKAYQTSSSRRALALCGIGIISSYIKNHLMSMVPVDPLASLDIFGQ